MNWSLIKRYGFVEVWKTPTRFLACDHFNGWYRFTDSCEEAVKAAFAYLDNYKK